MDSFCEDLIPRNAPKPSIAEPKPAVTPLVPEVSLIFDKTSQYTGACLPKKSYSEWEKENPQIVARLCNNNNNTTTGKQVRFEPSSILKFTDNLDLENAAQKKAIPNEKYEYQITNVTSGIPSFNTQLCAVSSTYRNEQTATTAPNYRSASTAYFNNGTNCIQQNNLLPNKTVTTDREIIQHNTILTEEQISAPQSELSKIYTLIKLQSEQLSLLQNQVNRLLINEEQKCMAKTTTTNDSTEVYSPLSNTLPPNLTAKIPKMVDKQVQCNLTTDNNKINKENVQTASIGVMTSFEYTSEEEKTNNSCDISKPESADLQCTNGKENICKTFYSSVLHDVNQFLDAPSNGILIKQKCCCDCQKQNNFHNNGYISCNNNLQQGRRTMEIMSRKSTDRSIVMNELALKYLSNDKLSELGVIGNTHVPQSQRQHFSQRVTEYGQQQPVSNRRPLNEMSLGTFRYMEKYGLISNSEESVMVGASSTQNNVIHCNAMNDPNKKFLDSTSISRQHKLI